MDRGGGSRLVAGLIGREISGFGHVKELDFYGRARKAVQKGDVLVIG